LGLREDVLFRWRQRAEKEILAATRLARSAARTFANHGRCTRQRYARLCGNLAQQVRIVGNDAIHAQLQYELHVGFAIDGPHHDLESEAVRCPDVLPGYFAVVR
jgi:hypothetical protein